MASWLPLLCCCGLAERVPHAHPGCWGRGQQEAPEGDAEPRGPWPHRWHVGITLGDAWQGSRTLGPERRGPSAVPFPRWRGSALRGLRGPSSHPQCARRSAPDLARSLGYLAAAGWPCRQARQTAVAAADGPCAPREAPTERVWRGRLVFGDVPPWRPARYRPGTGATAGSPKLQGLHVRPLSIVLWNLLARVSTGFPTAPGPSPAARLRLGPRPKPQPTGSRRSSDSMS